MDESMTSPSPLLRQTSIDRVMNLVHLGFAEIDADAAVRATPRSSIEAAIDFLMRHEMMPAANNSLDASPRLHPRLHRQDSQTIRRFTSMGFSVADATEALFLHNDDFMAALDWLLERPNIESSVVQVPPSSVTERAEIHDITEHGIEKLDDKLLCESGVTCGICLDRISDVSRKPSCGHSFHDECWRGFFVSKIQDKSLVLCITCPGIGCARAILDQEILGVISPQEADQYKRFKDAALLEKDPLVRWCPLPDCGRSIHGWQWSQQGAGRLTLIQMAGLIVTAACLAPLAGSIAFGPLSSQEKVVFILTFTAAASASLWYEIHLIQSVLLKRPCKIKLFWLQQVHVDGLCRFQSIWQEIKLLVWH